MSKLKIIPIVFAFFFLLFFPIRMFAQTSQDNSVTTFLEVNTSQNWDLNIEGLNDGEENSLENISTANTYTTDQITNIAKPKNTVNDSSWIGTIVLILFFLMLALLLLYIWKVNVKKVSKQIPEDIA